MVPTNSDTLSADIHGCKQGRFANGFFYLQDPCQWIQTNSSGAGTNGNLVLTECRDVIGVSRRHIFRKLAF